MSDTLAIAFDLSGMHSALDTLEDEIRKSVRPAAQAGAQVLYDEVRIRVAAIGRVTGNLYDSIYQAYSKDNSSGLSATYHISWNARKAPHGHLVEYGHMQTRKVYMGKDGKWYTSPTLLAVPVRVAAQPFIRPAFDAKGAAALHAAADHFVNAMRDAIARL